MTRILFACTEVHSHGGIQRFNRNLIQSWIDSGFIVDVLSVNDNRNFEDVYSECKSVNQYFADKSKLKWIRYYCKLLSKKKYDIYVCGHINLTFVFVSLLLIFGRFRKKTILIIHGVEIWDCLGLITRIFVRKFNNVLAVSNYTLNSFLSQVKKYPESKTIVFPNTLNTELYKVEKKASKISNGSDVTSIISVSRLDFSEREKGIIDVLDSLMLIKDKLGFRYFIIGDGNDKEYLESYSKKMGLSHFVTFLGSVTDERLWRLYSNSDIFILPSKKEGFGIVFLEAMYFELPVIGASEKGATDVINDGENGFLIEYADKHQIADCILKLSRNHRLRKSMGKAGRKMVANGGKFSYESFRNRSKLIFSSG